MSYQEKKSIVLKILLQILGFEPIIEENLINFAKTFVVK